MTTQSGRPPFAPFVVGVAIPAVLWTCFFAGLIFVVPGYKKIFANFNMKLPAATIFLLNVSDWVNNYWYILALFLPFFLAADVAVILLLGRAGRRGLVQLWCGLMIALPLVAGLLAVVAIHLALTSLLEGLSR